MRCRRGSARGWQGEVRRQPQSFDAARIEINQRAPDAASERLCPQRQAEALIREEVADALGVELKPTSVLLGERATVAVDGASPDESVLVEIFARQGTLKAGQKQKVKGDALKLIALAQTRPGARLVLAFGSEDAARFVLEASWVAEALRFWGIEVFVAKLEPDVRSGLRATQARQVMINPPTRASSTRRAPPW